MNPFPHKPLREMISFKQHEQHIMQKRDVLCAHYRLNKSDLVKFLIRKEELSIRFPNNLMNP